MRENGKVAEGQVRGGWERVNFGVLVFGFGTGIIDAVEMEGGNCCDSSLLRGRVITLLPIVRPSHSCVLSIPCSTLFAPFHRSRAFPIAIGTTDFPLRPRMIWPKAHGQQLQS